ncbi:MAG: nucleotidyltransferase family protein [Lachnospiraceae bacterium]|nr:nucleotidyltransferase family protein [Lachnospiraceae bacterium]
MTTGQKPEGDRLLSLLARALQDSTENTLADCDWAALVELAAKHGVVSLIYEELRAQKVPQAALIRAEGLSQTVVRQNYRLLYLSWQIQQAMGEQGIRTALLKGAGTASFYPVPELRKSGDIDLLLLDPGDLEQATKCLERLGFRRKEWQPALHHIVYVLMTEGGKQEIEAELHTMLAEPFDDSRINALLERQVGQATKHLQTVQVMELPLQILDPAYHAYELLLHMLQHFLRSGFGLKLLCDWVVLWNGEISPAMQEEYLGLVKECGIKKFSDLVSLTCVNGLGLPAERIAFMKPDTGLETELFLAELLSAEEFGKTSKDRMVALRGNSPWDYVREFHHQMRLNYPRAGKCILFWPVLWFMTLVRFLINNRRIRKVSLGAVLKTAGQRGKLIKNLQLFRQER